jgi:hypothetical protein
LANPVQNSPKLSSELSQIIDTFRRPDYALRNAQVTVCENAKGEVTILYNHQPLVYSIFHKPTRQAEVVDTKTLDHHLQTSKPPDADHPWRRYGRHLDGKPIQELAPNGTD